MSAFPQQNRTFSPDTPVYSYVRFSTPEQRKGTGKWRQDQAAVEWCKAHGLTLTSNYADLGVSAFKSKNSVEGALSKFLELVKDGRVRTGSILLVESLDRLSRDKINLAAELFLGIVNRGITVVTLCDGYTYSPETFNFAQLVMSLAIFMRANDESSMKSSRKGASWKFKRERAKSDGAVLGGRTPRWIKVVEGRYQVIQSEADKVRAIFRDYVNGQGIYSLNKKYGIPKPTISFWLSCPVVLGTVTVTEGNKKYEIPNHYPAIIDQATWNKAQAAKSRRFIERRDSGRTGFVNLFSGLLFGPKGERFDVARHYGFSSYLADGYVLQARPLEIAICLYKLADKFIETSYAPEEKLSAKVGLLDKKIAEIKKALLEDSALAGDLLPVLKTLRMQRQQEAQAGTVIRKKVSLDLVKSLMAADDSNTQERLRMREIIRDSVDEIRVTHVQSSNWYTLIGGQVTLIDGQQIPFRFAYCSRRQGIVVCDGPQRFYYASPPWETAPGHDVEIVKTDSITPELIAALSRLPLRTKTRTSGQPVRLGMIHYPPGRPREDARKTPQAFSHAVLS